MSKKHFEALAEALRNTRPQTTEGGLNNEHLQWNFDVKAVADVCVANNSNFRYSQFVFACGGLF